MDVDVKDVECGCQTYYRDRPELEINRTSDSSIPKVFGQPSSNDEDAINVIEREGQYGPVSIISDKGHILGGR